MLRLFFALALSVGYSILFSNDSAADPIQLQDSVKGKITTLIMTASNPLAASHNMQVLSAVSDRNALIIYNPDYWRETANVLNFETEFTRQARAQGFHGALSFLPFGIGSSIPWFRDGMIAGKDSQGKKTLFYTYPGNSLPGAFGKALEEKLGYKMDQLPFYLEGGGTWIFGGDLLIAEDQVDRAFINNDPDYPMAFMNLQVRAPQTILEGVSIPPVNFRLSNTFSFDRLALGSMTAIPNVGFGAPNLADAAFWDSLGLADFGGWRNYLSYAWYENAAAVLTKAQLAALGQSALSDAQTRFPDEFSLQQGYSAENCQYLGILPEFLDTCINRFVTGWAVGKVMMEKVNDPSVFRLGTEIAVEGGGGLGTVALQNIPFDISNEKFHQIFSAEVSKLVKGVSAQVVGGDDSLPSTYFHLDMYSLPYITNKGKRAIMVGDIKLAGAMLSKAKAKDLAAIQKSIDAAIQNSPTFGGVTAIGNQMSIKQFADAYKAKNPLIDTVQSRLDASAVWFSRHGYKVTRFPMPIPVPADNGEPVFDEVVGYSYSNGLIEDFTNNFGKRERRAWLPMLGWKAADNAVQQILKAEGYAVKPIYGFAIFDEGAGPHCYTQDLRSN